MQPLGMRQMCAGMPNWLHMLKAHGVHQRMPPPCWRHSTGGLGRSAFTWTATVLMAGMKILMETGGVTTGLAGGARKSPARRFTCTIGLHGFSPTVLFAMETGSATFAAPVTASGLSTSDTRLQTKTFATGDTAASAKSAKSGRTQPCTLTAVQCCRLVCAVIHRISTNRARLKSKSERQVRLLPTALRSRPRPLRALRPKFERNPFR